MLRDKQKSNIKAIEEILFRNKVGNYTIHPMRLLAYIIVKFGQDTSVAFSYKDAWLKENFTRVQFQRSLAFLKQKDILQTLITRREPAYKVNYQFLSRIVIESLDIEALMEIRNFIIRRRKKKKLRVKKLKQSSANFSLIGNNRRNATAVSTSKSNSRESISLESSVKELNVDSRVSLFIKETKKRQSRKPKIRKDSTKQYGEFKFNPSENPKLQSWQDRDIGMWRSVDFLGYYICLYKEETGFENISLQDFQAYTKVKRMIRAMLEHWFNNGRALMRDYLKWSVGYFTHEMNGRYSPSIETLLNPFKKTRWVYDLFVKNRSKKGKRKKDSDWASQSKWKE